MSPRRALPDRLLIVTDRHQAAGPLVEVVAASIEEGARWVWLRDKDLPPGERNAVARDIAALARRHAATLSVGGDVALAAEVGAGVHLGGGADVGAARRMLGPGALIGVSAHGLEELRVARAAGADYATLSPIFPSASKPGYGPALGLRSLRDAAAIGLPVLALGGITAQNARACLLERAAGVAVMGSAMREARTVVRALSLAWAGRPPIDVLPRPPDPPAEALPMAPFTAPG